MSIISLEEKRLRVEKKKSSNNPDDELSEYSSNRGFSKIVQIGHFLRLKQTAHWENIKLRNGLVQKIHDIRRLAESLIQDLPEQTVQDIKAEFLMIASDFVDEVLYSEELTTIELLNKYMECKNIISDKVEVFTKIEIL